MATNTGMTSDYRGHYASQSFVNVSQSSPPRSYSGAIAKKVRPKQEQSIHLDSIEGCSNDDYLDGLEELTDITNIIWISKISRSRVCVFVKNEKIVESLIDKWVKVKEHKLKVRPVIGKNKRVVISNVNPSIPDEILLDVLNEKGINPVSGVTDIRASVSKPGRSHIFSFRRQVYIQDEDENKLPDSCQISFKNQLFWIYFTTDSTCCFLCKQSGHIAKLCPNSNNESNTNASQTINNSQRNINTDPNTIDPSNSVMDTTIIENQNNNKRPRSPSTISSISTHEKSLNTTEITNPRLEEYPVLEDPRNSYPEFTKPMSKKKKLKETPEYQILPRKVIRHS